MSKNGVRKNVLGGVHTARLLKYVGPIFQHCACSYPNYLTLCLTLIVINTVSSTATRATTCFHLKFCKLFYIKKLPVT